MAMVEEETHNPAEPEFGDKHGGEHNPGEPKFGEGDRPDHPAEGTSPPGNPERDEEAIRKGEEKLEQAGH
jgi:hypothetical protein